MSTVKVRIPLCRYTLVVELRDPKPAPASPGKRQTKAQRTTASPIKRLTLSAACWSDRPEYLKKVLLQLPDVVSVAFEPKEKA